MLCTSSCEGTFEIMYCNHALIQALSDPDSELMSGIGEGMAAFHAAWAETFEASQPARFKAWMKSTLERAGDGGNLHKERREHRAVERPVPAAAAPPLHPMAGGSEGRRSDGRAQPSTQPPENGQFGDHRGEWQHAAVTAHEVETALDGFK